MTTNREKMLKIVLKKVWIAHLREK